MSISGLRQTTTRRWTGVLHGLRADALDCRQTTLALFCDQAHGAGEHLRLGARWIMPAKGPDGVTGLGITLSRRLADARELLGLRVGADETRSGPDALRSLQPGEAAYLVADAFRLPWLPYAGHQHMEHSFLVEQSGGTAVVVDAYHNDTPWGAARPGAWTVPTEELGRILGDEVLMVDVAAGELPPRDRASHVAANAERARAADIDGYLEQRLGDDPAVLRELVLDIWLLARERQLHAYWLGPAHPAHEQATDWVAGWHRLAMQSFVALRRVERGGPAHTGLGDQLRRQLHEDLSFAELCQKVTSGDEPARSNDVAVATVVQEAIAAALSLPSPTIHSGLLLRSLPGFDSFRLVEIIDRVETRLGVLLPADIGADELIDVAGLCRAFARAQPTA